MFRVSSLVVILLGPLLCILSPLEAMAQQSGEGGVPYDSARNMIGLLRYCRSNRLLDPILAGQAIFTLETGLGDPPPDNSAARERGDRSQQAGEDGIWTAGGGRDIATAAKLMFRATPEDLCRGWAEGAMVKQDGRIGKPSIAAATPARLSAPSARAEPPNPRPKQKDAPFASASVGASVALNAGPPSPPEATPPLPEKAPARPPVTEVASLPRATPTGGKLSSTSGAASGQSGGRKAASPDASPPASVQAEPPISALAVNETAATPRGEQPVPAETEAPSVWKKWPFNRLGKTERCLMAGCKWSPPRERRALGY